MLEDNQDTNPPKLIEWQTATLLLACYSVWMFTTYFFVDISALVGPWVGYLMLFGVTAIATAFHTSLQHEAVHGHPTRWPLLNEVLVFPSLVIVYPFRRYMQLHLKHHEDANLTDPYEDPESYYWPWDTTKDMAPWLVTLLSWNNTFVGRMILGPPLGVLGFYRTEFKRLMDNETGVRQAWALHACSVGIVWFWVSAVCSIPFWLYLLLVVYPGVAWILVRSFAEHQAANAVGARTAVVEAHIFFSMLFLNNNLHVVHHAHPSVPWYDLPRLYKQRRKNYLAANESYLFNGYGEIVRKFAFTLKQPLYHPNLHTDASPNQTNDTDKSDT